MEGTDASRVKAVDKYTLEIQKEDHTLTNILKWVISSNMVEPPVDFCGYTIPHPSDNLVTLTIQFENGEEQASVNVLQKVVSATHCIDACCVRLRERLDAAVESI